MIYKAFFIFLAMVIFSPTIAFSQIGNTNGKYDSLIMEAFKIIHYLRNKEKKAVLNHYKPSGYQEKKDFKHFLSDSNLEWVESIIGTHGEPPKEEVSISEWSTVSNKNEYIGTSVNLTFFIKNRDVKFSHTNDHISMNYQKDKSGIFHLDGLMFFRKDEYNMLKKLIDEIPQ